MKTYVTFGQIHNHLIDGKFFDKDCVAVITSGCKHEGRSKAFELFGTKFCFEYPEEHFNLDEKMPLFSRGLIEVN